MIRIFIVLVLLAANGVEAANERFRFHIVQDPMRLRPLKSAGGSTSHLLNNLFRGFYWQSDEEGLKPELVTCRRKTSLLYECRLRDGLKYSNGSPIAIDDFIRTFHEAIKGEADPGAISHLQSLKNAVAILNKKKTVEELGIRKISDRAFVIELDQPDEDLLARFASAVWTPLPSADVSDEEYAKNYATGPYRLRVWNRNRSLILEPNPHYVGAHPEIEAEVLIVTEDTTALKLYQKGQLDFLRRIPAEHYQEVKNDPGFKFRPLLRMDYFGFGGELIHHPEVREAMAYALNFEEFKKIFHALGRPGCFGLGSSLTGEPVCFDFDLQRARKIWDSVQEKPQRLKLYVAAQGGDDLSRAAQWFQSQWKKNLGLQADIEVTEFSLLTRLLKTAPPDIFRRGVPLDRASCLAGLEPFTEGNPDNFLKIHRPKVERIVKLLRTEALDAAKKKQLCREALEDLLKSHQIIPTGELHFMTMLKKSFVNVELNALNQLNLAGLRKLKPDQSPSDK